MVLVGIVGVFRKMRHGDFDEQDLEEKLSNRGLLNRVYWRARQRRRQPWQMYPSVSSSGWVSTQRPRLRCSPLPAPRPRALPWYAILCLPILFAAGMSLLDTIDGAFMNFAYGWAFSKPVRKVFYNLTVTALSVFVALIIGTIELIGVLADRLSRQPADSSRG